MIHTANTKGTYPDFPVGIQYPDILAEHTFHHFSVDDFLLFEVFFEAGILETHLLQFL